MLFNSIEIFNFGRYKDRNFFDTTVDPKKSRNVILVSAKNDRGKTTLFYAVKFALHGLPIEQVRKWVNFQSASEEDGEMFVEIKFAHENKNYTIRRSIKFRQTNRGEEIDTIGKPDLSIYENDVPINVGDNKQEWINHILPEDASQFFLFDGEEIKKYIEKPQENVKQAIEKVLGIRELLNARDDLNTVQIENFDKEYNKHVREHTRDEREKGDFEKLENDINLGKQTLEFHERSLQAAIEQKDKYRKELEKYKEIKEDVKQRDDFENRLKKVKQEKNRIEKDLSIKRGHLGMILLGPLLKQIDKTEENPPSNEQWESQTVQHMLKHDFKNCLCNRKIDDEIIKILKTKILNLEPTRSSFLKRFVEKVLINSNPEAKFVGLNNSLEALGKINQDMDNIDTSIITLNEKIQKNENVGELVKEYEDKYEEAIRDIERYENDKKELEEQLGKAINQKKKLEQKIETSVTDKNLDEASKRKEVCEKIRNAIESSISKFYQIKKPELEKHITSIFRRLTNNPELYEGLEIEDNFEMRVIRKDGTKLPTYTYSPSAGASQIVATAMIGGLNKFTTRQAPVLIDTPLGRLDPIHRQNLIEYYSQIGPQVIILYQPSELDDGDIEIIRNNLASEWEIDSIPGSADISKITRGKNYL